MRHPTPVETTSRRFFFFPFLPPPQGHISKWRWASGKPQFGRAYYERLYLLRSMAAAVYGHAHNFRPKQARQLMDKLLPAPPHGSIPDRKKRHCRAGRRFRNAGLNARYVSFKHRCSSRITNYVKNATSFAQEVTLRNPQHSVRGFSVDSASNVFTHQF